jgi:hypothetical protein
LGYIPYQLNYSQSHPWGTSNPNQKKWGLLFDQNAGIWTNGDFQIITGYKGGLQDKLGSIELRTFKTYLTLPDNFSGNQTITFGGYAPMKISTGANTSSQQCKITISSADEMQIDANGDININTTTAQFRVSGSGNRIASPSGASLGSKTVRFGTVYCSDVSDSSSDRKLKDVLGQIDFAEDLIMSLTPISFMWKNGDHRRARMGFVAQDVAKICKNLNQNLSLVSASYIEEDDKPYYGE